MCRIISRFVGFCKNAAKNLSMKPIGSQSAQTDRQTDTPVPLRVETRIPAHGHEQQNDNADHINDRNGETAFQPERAAVDPFSAFGDRHPEYGGRYRRSADLYAEQIALREIPCRTGSNSGSQAA